MTKFEWLHPLSIGGTLLYALMGIIIFWAAFIIIDKITPYDLWGEIYEVAVTGPSGRRLYRVKYKAEALKLVTGLDQVAIAEVGAIAERLMKPCRASRLSISASTAPSLGVSMRDWVLMGPNRDQPLGIQ